MLRMQSGKNLCLPQGPQVKRAEQDGAGVRRQPSIGDAYSCFTSGLWWGIVEFIRKLSISRVKVDCIRFTTCLKCLTTPSVPSVTWMSLILITLRSYRMEICPTDFKYSVVKARQKTVPRTGNFSSRYPHSWTRWAFPLLSCCVSVPLCWETEASRIFLLELSAWCRWQARFRLRLGLNESE